MHKISFNSQPPLPQSSPEISTTWHGMKVSLKPTLLVVAVIVAIALEIFRTARGHYHAKAKKAEKVEKKQLELQKKDEKIRLEQQQQNEKATRKQKKIINKTNKKAAKLDEKYQKSKDENIKIYEMYSKNIPLEKLNTAKNLLNTIPYKVFGHLGEKGKDKEATLFITKYYQEADISHSEYQLEQLILKDMDDVEKQRNVIDNLKSKDNRPKNKETTNEILDRFEKERIPSIISYNRLEFNQKAIVEQFANLYSSHLSDQMITDQLPFYFNPSQIKIILDSSNPAKSSHEPHVVSRNPFDEPVASTNPFDAPVDSNDKIIEYSEETLKLLQNQFRSKMRITTPPETFKVETDYLKNSRNPNVSIE